MIQINWIFRIRLAEMDHMEDVLRSISSARYVRELGSGKGCMFFFSLKYCEGNQKLHIFHKKMSVFTK